MTTFKIKVINNRKDISIRKSKGKENSKVKYILSTQGKVNQSNQIFRKTKLVLKFIILVS